MMNRANNVGPASKNFVLVAWQDSDVVDQIKDKSFAGKLLNKENQPEVNKTNEPAGITSSLKKKASIKRVSKKLSIVPNAETNQEILAASLGLTGNVFKKIENETVPLVNKLKPEYTEISNHFVFGNQVSEGLVNKTSNNKLDQSLRISYADMVETLKSYEPPYNEAIDTMNKSFENDYFTQWLGLMKFGFNVLLDGVGSKKALIQKFCQNHLTDFYYVELFGYHHDFNTKNLLKNILTDILELDGVYKTTDEQLNAIKENLKVDLYLIIHNIDGINLRDANVQNMLSELASNDLIHILASVDHVNSSLLWDTTQYLSFKWIHYETNTLAPYIDEIMFENSLMLSQASNVQLSSIIHILKSLTQNAKNIFLIMVQHVLNPDNIKKGITFTNLYHECRERFYVSNELTLRAQLTEFIDHKLIKIKTESDGYETIYLLIDEKNLRIYLEDLKDQV